MTTNQRTYGPISGLIAFIVRVVLFIWAVQMAFALVIVFASAPELLLVPLVVGIVWLNLRRRARFRYYARLNAAKAAYYRREQAERAQRYPDLVFAEHEKAWERELAV